KVLEAFYTVPRHRFVPDEFQQEAYEDHPLPIGQGQTISQPYIVAFMTELLDPQPSDTVLEIGTGSGYQTALLSVLCAWVYSMEIVPELGQNAARRLDRMGYKNIEVQVGDGYRGWPEHAPFNKIIITAAPPEIPATLVDQLAPGGILVVPAGPKYGGQSLWVVTRDGEGQITKRRSLPVAFVPMIHGNKSANR
ncbi:MAG: protein-L-isoaspartate(D-aspartate) O-methyltransferase, partial [Fidelibacterota bacterium]